MSEARSFESWAVLELMGHRQRVGFVQEVEIAGGKMLRIDIPTETGDVSEFYGVSSVYAMRPCEEDVARDLAKRYGYPPPIRPVAYRDGDPRAIGSLDDDEPF